MNRNLLLLITGVWVLGGVSISQAKKPHLKLPACGTLIENLYMLPADQAKNIGGHTERVTFLVSQKKGKPEVSRYAVVTQKGTFPVPLDTYTPWWVCIKTGEVLKEYDLDSREPGLVRIDSFDIDQTPSERGE